MRVDRPEEKNLYFNKQLQRVERGKTKASLCIRFVDVLCFAPRKRYNICDECPRIKKKKKNGDDSKGLFKKIVGSAIQIMESQSADSGPDIYNLKGI